MYDREFTRAAYFALGVAQVWLVSLDERCIDVWTSRDMHDVVRDVLLWHPPAMERVATLDVGALFVGIP